MVKTRILLVEDDPSLGFMLQENLTTDNWEVDWYDDGKKGLSAYHSNPYDIGLFDVMMPEKDGFELAEEIRKTNKKIPIVLITAKSQTSDKIKGFQMGADDYITKPFSLVELSYRIEAILKRTYNISTSVDNQSTLTLSNMHLDVNNLVLKVGELQFQLTYKEGQLMKMFLRNPNKIIERDTFLQTVWQEDGFFVARSMDVFISRLRKYLSSDTAIKIENIRGVGYRMVCTTH